MLILTRKPGERLIIGDDIEVIICGVHGLQVHMGIDAPPDIKIYREEIYKRIMNENGGNCVSYKRRINLANKI